MQVSGLLLSMTHIKKKDFRNVLLNKVLINNQKKTNKETFQLIFGKMKSLQLPPSKNYSSPIFFHH